MGVVTGRGLADLIRERFGVRFTLIAMAILVLANVANTASEFAGVAASLEIFGISRLWSVPFAAVLVFCLVAQGTYKAIERIFLAASAVYAVYFLSAFLADPPWATILRQTVRPTFSLQGGYLTTLITIVGTTIAPWMQFYLQSAIVDKGIRLRDLRWAKLDAYIGSVAAGLIAFFIIVACGATLYPHGIRVETAKDAALALEPFAGPLRHHPVRLRPAQRLDLLRRHPSPVHRLRRLRGAGLGDRRGPPPEGGARLLHDLHPDDRRGGGPDPPPARAPGGDHVLVADPERRPAAAWSCWSC